MDNITASDADRYAQNILRSYQSRLASSLPWGASLPPLQEPLPSSKGTSTLSVCIIGAGAAGLFAALTLELLIKKGVDIEYTILEAEPAEQPNGDAHPIGGRLWTKRFSGPGSGPNDYYDRGAMRFPEIPIMSPVFALFDFLEINPKNRLRIPYVMSIDENLRCFNGRTLSKAEMAAEIEKGNVDPFGTGIDGIDASPDVMVLNQIGDLKGKVRTNGPSELDPYDGRSTRDFMTSGAGPHLFTHNVVTYLETFELGSNMYDASISETVMEALNFDYNDGGKVDWWCIQGGSSVLAEKMAEHIPANKIINGMRVTSVAPVPLTTGTIKHVVTCARSAAPAPVTYDHVISTIPLSTLRTVDLSAYEAGWKVSTAIRTLSYGPSTKVGMRFASRWWENLETLSTTGAKNQRGGVTTTDRPTRVVVYPSYGIGSETGATMIVSYTWSQDALRLGSLDYGRGSWQEEELKSLILRDLAVIHGVTEKFLRDQLIDLDIMAWYNHVNSAGAFAWFNPGQFTTLYEQLTQPMLGSFHFAGEATSVYHAWVVGALNSAFRTLMEIGVHRGDTFMLDELEKLWPDIKEFNRDVVKQQVAFGQSR